MRGEARGRISIHAPLAGCDKGFFDAISPFNDFNPRTPCGVRHGKALPPLFAYIFQSTHPLRGATRAAAARLPARRFQSTHPLRGATTLWQTCTPTRSYFNPRTPCGVRRNRAFPAARPANFNPRTPCGVRPRAARKDMPLHGFQSTHPLRGATRSDGRAARSVDISIHAPLAGCDYLLAATVTLVLISIHAPLAGCDFSSSVWLRLRMVFQSTHPLRGATRRNLYL